MFQCYSAKEWSVCLVGYLAGNAFDKKDLFLYRRKNNQRFPCLNTEKYRYGRIENEKAARKLREELIIRPK